MRKHPKFKHFSMVEHLLVVVFTGVLAFIAYGILHLSVGFINPVKRVVENFSLRDLYYGVDWTGNDNPETSELITLIDATKYYERNAIADLLKEVDSCKPKVVGVDILFEGKMCDPVADLKLQQAVDSMSNAVFASKLLQYEEKDTLIQGKDTTIKVNDGSFHRAVHSVFCEESAPTEGYANTVGSPYSPVVRNLSIERKLNGKPVKSFAAAVVAADSVDCLPKTPQDKYPICYPHLDFPVVPCDSVLKHRELIEGRIALIGTLNSDEDMHFTPIGSMPGLKVQAYSIQTLLDGNTVNEIPDACYWLLIPLFTYLTVWWQFLWIHFCAESNKPWLTFLGESKLVLRVLTLLWLAVIAWLGYVLYDHFSWYFNSVWLLVCVVLVGEGRGVYTAILKTIRKYKRFGDSFVERSIYVGNANKDQHNKQS